MSLSRLYIASASLFLFCLGLGGLNNLWASETDASSRIPFLVREFKIEGNLSLPKEIQDTVFAAYVGTNITVEKLVKAATDLQSEYAASGYPSVSIVIGQSRITNGIVTMSVFEGAFPQIVISGTRYVISTNGVIAASSPTTTEIAALRNPPPVAPKKNENTQGFEVRRYVVEGNSLLSPDTIKSALTNATEAFGTNVTFDGILSAMTELQQAYRARGFVTASVGLPQQRLTNATVKVQVTEGKLEAINVVGNQYFSSNNVMRALPSLQTNIVLNGLIFQSELNRANANQDRQIYLPVIAPGSKEGYSTLTLKVKDRLPLHIKMELNNQRSPGTPELRLNGSAAYNNLWQLEHSMGVQYSFSPQDYKSGDQWNFYDSPAVANYSAFYRMPLGNPEAISDVVDSNPGTFGYSEAQRRFILPPPSGQAEVTLYASRSTIDTGVQSLSSETILDIPGVRSIFREDSQQDLTVNETLGFRLNEPIRGTDKFRGILSGGLDFKSYSLEDYKTNSFTLTEITYDANGQQLPPIVSTVNSPVPFTAQKLKYLPLSLGYNATWQIPRATLSFGLTMGGNAWYSTSKRDFQTVAGSTNTSGYWFTMDPSFSVDFVVVTNWVLSLRVNGRWSNEPLISNEQFGAGGVGSVRGYQEGESFGDTGWHLTLEQKTPAKVIGLVGGKLPLTVRGSIYMDYAETYLIDPQGRPPSTELWGAGFGFVASVGAYWEARLLFSVPLHDAGTIQAYEPFFNFALTAQF